MSWLKFGNFEFQLPGFVEGFVEAGLDDQFIPFPLEDLDPEQRVLEGRALVAALDDGLFGVAVHAQALEVVHVVGPALRQGDDVV
jgi:hypothetical protein